MHNSPTFRSTPADDGAHHSGAYLSTLTQDGGTTTSSSAKERRRGRAGVRPQRQRDQREEELNHIAVTARQATTRRARPRGGWSTSRSAASTPSTTCSRQQGSENSSRWETVTDAPFAVPPPVADRTGPCHEHAGDVKLLGPPRRPGRQHHEQQSSPRPRFSRRGGRLPEHQSSSAAVPPDSEHTDTDSEAGPPPPWLR